VPARFRASIISVFPINPAPIHHASETNTELYFSRTCRRVLILNWKAS
jgi:hypothetical protein